MLFTFDESGEEETGTGKDEEENVKEDTVKNVSEENKPEEKESKSKQPVPEESTNNILEFKLPELGENIESADIMKILVSAGDKVEVDQVLLEIETDKATVEVPAEFSGIVKEVKFKEGDTAKVGDIILVVQTGDLKLYQRESRPEDRAYHNLELFLK